MNEIGIPNDASNDLFWNVLNWRKSHRTASYYRELLNLTACRLACADRWLMQISSFGNFQHYWLVVRVFSHENFYTTKQIGDSSNFFIVALCWLASIFAIVFFMLVVMRGVGQIYGRTRGRSHGQSPNSMTTEYLPNGWTQLNETW